ncbi:peptidoglycan-binding protein [Microbacterium sp. GXF0217]
MKVRRKALRPVVLGMVMLLVAAGGVAGGWLVAEAFQSPEQIAAQSSPPPPSVITAEVTEGDLGEEITLRATVQLSNQEQVRLPADAADVVTEVPVGIGSEIAAGTVVSEVNGAPVFALPGEFPFYRDLRLGDSGPDVRMLQQALTAAGRSVEDDGTFGHGTASAVRWLYDTRGYVAPTSAADGGTVQPPPEESETDDSSGADQPASVSTSPVYPYLPLGAAIITGNLPAVASAVPAVGLTPEEGATLTLVSGSVRVVASVTAETSAQLSAGMRGDILDATAEAQVEIVEISSAVAEDGTVGVVFSAPDSLAGDAMGQEVVISVRLHGDQGTGWIVPTRAVISRSDTFWVRKLRDDGTAVEVQIEEIDSSLGMSQIEPTDAEKLKLGDEVLLE